MLSWFGIEEELKKAKGILQGEMERVGSTGIGLCGGCLPLLDLERATGWKRGGEAKSLSHGTMAPPLLRMTSGIQLKQV
jgi:hypothetical protein